MLIMYTHSSKNYFIIRNSVTSIKCNQVLHHRAKAWHEPDGSHWTDIYMSMHCSCQVGPFCHQLTTLMFCAVGFAAAMNVPFVNKAILQRDYIAYAYICAGAMECGIPNVVPSAFANVSLVAVLAHDFHAYRNLQRCRRLMLYS